MNVFWRFYYRWDTPWESRKVVGSIEEMVHSVPLYSKSDGDNAFFGRNVQTYGRL